MTSRYTHCLSFLAFLSAHKLATYDKPIFVSRELSPDEKKLENALLIKRRYLIDVEKIALKDLRIRNLKLQKKENKKWIDVDVTPTGSSSPPEQNWLQNKNKLQILSFNVRSLLDFQRRQIFANEIAKRNYDVLCLTETWLTSDVLDNALFLTGYTIHRIDRPTENHNSKHGGVLIAVKDIPHYRLKNTTHSESVSIALQTSTESLVICCMYNPPKSSPYRAPASQPSTHSNEMFRAEPQWKRNWTLT